MQDLKPTQLAGGFILPEGPRWANGRLYLSDIFGERVATIDPDNGNVTTLAEVPQWPSGLGFRDGRLIIVSMCDGLLLTLNDDQELETIADLSSYGDGTHYWGSIINDMVIDGRGNAYIGVYGVGEDHKSTGILLVRPDDSVEVVATDILGVNGLIVTPDYRTLIVAELGSDHLTGFDIQPDGMLANRRVWARVPESTPDGICLDAEGAVWFGSIYQGEFVRVREGGEVLQRIQLDRCAVAPAFGGPNRSTLYLCTADTTKERLAQKDSEGFVEYVEVEVPGAGWP